jgi:hypothetical protein
MAILVAATNLGNGSGHAAATMLTARSRRADARRPRRTRSPSPGPCPATARPARRPVLRLAHRARLPGGIARCPRYATRTGGRSTRWFAAIVGDRHRHAVATRIRRSPIRARVSATGESGSRTQQVVRGPGSCGGPRSAVARLERVPGRLAHNRHRALPATRGPRRVTGSAHRTLRGHLSGGWRSTWRSRGDSLRDDHLTGIRFRIEEWTRG